MLVFYFLKLINIIVLKYTSVHMYDELACLTNDDQKMLKWEKEKCFCSNHRKIPKNCSFY